MPGRAFLRRLIDLTIGVSKPFHFICIMKRVHDDLNYEARSCQSSTIGPFFSLPDVWSNSETLNLSTDASGSLGYGVVFGARWLYGEWSEEWKGENITLLELYHTVLAVTTRSASLANQCICFHTDNYALVSIINQQTSRHKPTMYLIQRLVLTCLRFNIMFQAHHNYSRQEQCPSRSPFTPADCEVPTIGSRGSCKTQTHSNTFPLSPLISTQKQLMDFPCPLYKSDMQKSMVIIL